MTDAIEARGLGKRYGRTWAVKDCSFRLPAGRICGLVGPNGAGKSTLLGMATRLVQPTEGTLHLFGVPVTKTAVLAKSSFLAQDKPLFTRFTVEETLRMGQELNPTWDQALAERIVRAGNLSFDSRVGTLSGGQRTRVAFALAFGKRPELLLLDEPMADLDPLARHEMAGLLMAEAAEQGTTVVMSSHMLSELETMCDYLVVVSEGRVRLAGEVDALLPAHALVTGAQTEDGMPPQLDLHTVIESHTVGRQFTALIRPVGKVGNDWRISTPTLEEVLLGYLRTPDAPPLLTPSARVEEQGAAA
ncbi:ABC transporter ATP-binding protein [Streptomyces sp. NPDC057654]|uniref:ABC transporter ATP-binding protein n=1 Tax=Streptomyces sp. NPDC057654 TaxID=3346196 RepID=UPI0036ADD1EF